VLIKRKGDLNQLRGKNKSLPDLCLVIAMLLLVAFGCLMVYSASSYSAELEYGNSAFFLRKQIIGAIAGVGACLFMYFFSYEKLKKLKFIGLIVSVILLLLVFLPVIGVKTMGQDVG